jgi:tripartite-type tricarboxylate transporter receptor subunit TctC
MSMQNRIKLLVLAVTCVVGMAATATAQNFPSRPITIVVPFAAGGPTDTVARVVAEHMRTTLGQPLIVENVVGASGTVGTGRVARAVADGHTVIVGFWGTHVLNGALFTLQYDVLKDFAPIALLATNPQLIVARNALPPTDLNELIAWLKANPGKASQGTAGVGSPAHVGGVFFQNMTHTQFQFVPYSRGAAPAMQDLIAGQIDLMFDQASHSLPHVRNGSIKAYAVTAGARLPSAPEIPTVDDAGLPGLHVSVWSGMWAPKATPEPVMMKLNDAVASALADPRVKKRLADLGQEIPVRELQTLEGFAAFQKAEIDKWWPIMKAANIRGGSVGDAARGGSPSKEIP